MKRYAMAVIDSTFLSLYLLLSKRPVLENRYFYILWTIHYFGNKPLTIKNCHFEAVRTLNVLFFVHGASK